MKPVNSSISSSKPESAKRIWPLEIAKTCALIIGWVLLADIAVQTGLSFGNKVLHGKLDPIVTYFDYGRSVPGKLKQQFNEDAAPVKAAWRDALLETSAAQFAQYHAPSYRFYGMSFSNHIAKEWRALDPTIQIDEMNGPGAPANATFDWAIADRANRREGDVVVWTILSSSLSGMASLSRQTWSFEQPTPFTAPVYSIENGALVATRPIVDTYEKAKQAQGNTTSAIAQNWITQLKTTDLNYSPYAYALPRLDILPSARMIRRAVATADIKRRRKAIVGIGRDKPLYPYTEILKLMASELAQQTTQDRQHLIILLVQTQEPGPDLNAELGPWLDQQGIDYFATATIAEPSEPANYIADGHFKAHVDKAFAQAMAAKMAAKNATPQSQVP